MLWLALNFPLLPLEALPWRRSPSAVVARGRVRACDRAAAAAGVAIGQKLSTALGLQPGLVAGAPHLDQFIDQIGVAAAQFIQDGRTIGHVQRVQTVESRAQAPVARDFVRVYGCSVFSSHARALSHLRFTALGCSSSAAAVCSMVRPRK